MSADSRRTCIGCRTTEHPDQLVRVVTEPTDSGLRAVVDRDGDDLFVHSDTDAYLQLGRTVDAVNAAGREMGIQGEELSGSDDDVISGDPSCIDGCLRHAALLFLLAWQLHGKR